MLRLAIFGNPVSHSLSAQLHNAFAQQFQLNIQYEKIATPLNQFKKHVDDFRAQKGLGANITIPFKTQAFEYADQLTNRAKSAGAVNTFIFKNDICIGDNTDGAGLLSDFEKKSIDVRDKNILILGAGGGARGILRGIIQKKPNKIFICNRTSEKIKQLHNDFRAISTYDNSPCDIIINATNMNFQTDLLLNLSLKDTLCYDLNYGERHKTFYDYCKSHDAEKITDGMDMLIEQAAEAFFQWFGKKPNTKRIRQICKF